MDREYELVELLRTFPRGPAEEKALQDLVSRAIAEARLPGQVAARLWANGDDAVAMGAYELLQGIGELAVEPLVQGPHARQPERISQALDLVVHGELDLRTRVLQYVDGLLSDQRPIPPPPLLGPKPEEVPDERRVCDEAYVAMRHLVHFGESAWDRLNGARQFYRSPVDVRDAAIAEARRTNEWRSALRGPDAGEPG